MLRTVVAVFKGPAQTKEALEEIQGESLANSKISLVVRQDFLRQRNFAEEIASELSYRPVEKNLDLFNAWLVQAPPFDIPNLGVTLAAGPIANTLSHLPDGAGLADALLSHGLSGERARHYEHEVRTGHYLVLVETEREKVNSVANALSSFGGRDVEKWSKELEHPLFPAH
ncbi:Hypothetical protein DEACI_2726 [Acididesulfobacillus acetoxydans]|uniref:Uncharacterized protein n=1 Tax=Acididesulfobacillus acetoxydans TaxID=1561005 RepID=A0A8S0WPN9_9FIRM|nr:hypothetical protein [Acididesulfobacillus acetoxydans]CAA7602054.1 Hypothetical protein DEACI_2726 [Acididesulfobacillus acetoxydans]CEJ08103.1 Hypothetical protein DEACI_2578 [Acididesulfobacillus acetoxydans]